MNAPCVAIRKPSLKLTLGDPLSQVALPAKLLRSGITGRELLALARSGHFSIPEAVVEEIEVLDAEDRPPEDKWRST